MARGERGLSEPRLPLGWLAGLAVAIAIAISLALLAVYWRAPPDKPSPSHAAADSLAGAAGGVLAAPVRWTDHGVDSISDYFLAGRQNAELRRRLQIADGWRDRALAGEQENARLRALLGVRTDPPLPMVFAHTVLDARGPFSNSRLADAGSTRGVIEGNPVLSEHGLIGRVTGVAPGMSRVLLLTDVMSRTPVLLVRGNGRAILEGDGGANPVLAYLRTHETLREGDRVLTSGDGGVLPRGLPVGTVTRRVDGAWRVALDSDAAPIDDVRILLFRDFAQLAPERLLAPGSPPSLATGAPASVDPATIAAPAETLATIKAPKP